MKREFLKELGLEDETINKIMAEHGKDIESYKTRLTDTEQKLTGSQGQVAQYETKIAELEKVLAGNAKLKQQLDALNAQIAQIAVDREAAQKAQADKELTDKVIAAFGDRKFVNAYTRDAMVAEVKAEMGKAENTGKEIREIFEGLTKDKDGIFANPNPADMPGMKDVNLALKREDFEKMGYSARLALMKEQPEVYKKMVEEK